MDFTIQYTKEQEDFRKEVRDWLEQNARYPSELGDIPPETDHYTDEMKQWGLDFTRKLGEKGWLFPLWDKEYGGGGLTADHDIIIREELDRYTVPEVGKGDLQAGSIAVHGTDEQKKRFLSPILRGEAVCWQLFTEPNVGSDLASLQTQAVRDGDDFIITGQKVFVGDSYKPDWLWALAVTDPDAPRHQNMGAFFMPADLPGITINDLNLVVQRGKRMVSLDGVRVSREYLVGEETQGWRVAQTTLELEHGAAGFLGERDSVVRDAIEYTKETVRNGQPLSKDPFVQQAMVDNYIETNIHRLLGLRNYWMFNNGEQVTYHGSQNSLLWKEFALKAADRILHVLGPYALANDKKWGALQNKVEHHQRESLVNAHPGGTLEVQKLIMARRLGISRTQERAAPTQAPTQRG